MTESPKTKPEFRAAGDRGLAVIIGETPDRATASRVLHLRRLIDSARLHGVIETVPSYLSVLVHYDPLQQSQSVLREEITKLIMQAEQTGAGENNDTTSAHSAIRKIPVCFDGDDFALHLGEVAKWSGLAAEEIINTFTAARQFVYMLGFAPGMPYIGDLPDRLAIPRRETPIAKVPAGSVMIATGKTVIYPYANPTGWFVIGRTPVPIVDLAREDPFLLKPGDGVCFAPIDAGEFAKIAEAVAAGAYDSDTQTRVNNNTESS